MDLTSRKNLNPNLASLVEKRFISMQSGGGKTSFIVHDPRIAIEHLATTGTLKPQLLTEIDEFYKDLAQPVVTR